MQSKTQKQHNKTLLCLIFGLFIWYVLVHDVLGGTLFSYHPWDSYTLQALSWRNGTATVENYSWLEIACYNGQYYISFPPVPSLVMLPLTFIFEEVPSNFVVACYALISVALAYKLLWHFGFSALNCAVFSVVCVMGSNMLWMSTIGGVWFLAQGLNMVLCLAAVLCAVKNKRYAAYALLALAVGCRPFSALYFILLIFIFMRMDIAQYGYKKATVNQLKYLIIPAIIAALYMAYNYIRFDNPLEFGHNYLPEFMEQEQFSFKYIPQNLYNLFIRTVSFEEGVMQWPKFDGFMFYIANPLYLIWFIRIFKDIKYKRFDAVRAVIVSLVFVNILLLCMHKTLGGWQFGARYTVDMLPFVLYYIAMGERRFKAHEYLIGGFALAFNVYGLVIMNV